MRAGDGRELLAAAILAAAVAFAFQGSRALWDPDEGRYTNVAHEMLDSGDWLVPRLDPEREHFTKPPLTYWTLAASLRAFGSSEWSARLPNALAFVATALLLFLMMRHVDPRRALLAASCWATMLAPAAAANVISADTLLTAFETLALFGFVSSGIFTASHGPVRGRIGLMWLGFALAFLTKGPPALLPLLAIVAWTAKWRTARTLARLFPVGGLLVFVVVGFGWYVMVVKREPHLLSYFLHSELIGRVVSPVYGRNSGWTGVLTAYGPMVLIGTLPWLPIVLFSRLRARRSRQPIEVAATEVAPPVTARHAGAPVRDARAFLSMWLLVPLAVFLMSQSRLPLYLLPLLVPVSMLFALALPSRFLQRRAAIACTVLAAAGVVAIKAAGVQFDSPRDAAQFARELQLITNTSRYDDIVFIDTLPAYGLRHYLDKVVEEVETRRNAKRTGGYVVPENLCSELGSGERVLYVTPVHAAAAAAGYSQRCGHELREIGRLRDYVLMQAGASLASAEVISESSPARR